MISIFGLNFSKSFHSDLCTPDRAPTHGLRCRILNFDAMIFGEAMSDIGDFKRADWRGYFEELDLGGTMALSQNNTDFFDDQLV